MKQSLIFAYFVLFIALTISAVAGYYSIVGLTAIFSGAAFAVAVMGAVLEVGKLVTASTKVIGNFLTTLRVGYADTSHIQNFSWTY